MKKKQPRKALADTVITNSSFMDQLDCFGDYSKSNRLCARYCALRLRCAIEQDQFRRMEIIEDLVAAEDPLFRIQ
jgi:hypothetical protein